MNPVEFYRPDVPLLDRDNVGLVLLLQPKIPSGASPAICVANTHLLYNPRRGDIKLTQLAMLLAEISSVAHQKDGSFCPIVMCGDFNSVPGSPLYSFIKEGKLNYEGLAIGKVSARFVIIRRWTWACVHCSVRARPHGLLGNLGLSRPLTSPSCGDFPQLLIRNYIYLVELQLFHLFVAAFRLEKLADSKKSKMEEKAKRKTLTDMSTS